MTQEEVKKIISEKIDGIWEARHDGNGHKYCHLPSGTIQKSVTTKIGSVISKPHLLKWSIKVGIEWLCKEDRLDRLKNEHWRDEMIQGAQMAYTDIRDTAGNVGTLAHGMIERYINEWVATNERPKDIKYFAPENCDARAIASARAFESWLNKFKNVEPVVSEILVGNKKYSAGQLDFLCLIDSELTLIDHKTSNGVDNISYSMQVSAYKSFFEEMTGLKIKKCKILHLSKDFDKFTVYNVLRLNSAYKAFKQVCLLFDWIYSPYDKIVKDVKRIKI